MDTIRQAEIDRFRGRLGPLNAEQEAAVEAMTRGIINKILHTPIRTLKSAAKDPESATVVDVVKQIFNLSAKEAAANTPATKSSDPNAPNPELQEERLKQ
jgi:glutamyl-tRNA reductase